MRQSNVQAYLRDMRTLRPFDIKNIVITLVDTANPTVAGAGSQDRYQVPSTHKFLLTEVRASVQLIDLSKELAASAEVPPLSPTLAPDLEARLLARALRTTCRLWSVDREENIIEQAQITVAEIAPLCGGEPLRFDPQAHIVMPGETLGFETTYYGSGPLHVITGSGGSIPYNVCLTIHGCLIPKNVPTEKMESCSLHEWRQEMSLLTPIDYRRQAIVLETKPPVDLSEAAEVTWRISGTHRLAIHEIRGHATFDQLEEEIDASTPFTPSQAIKQRLIGRTSRCYARLQTTDNGETVDLIKGDARQTATGGGGVSIASILPTAGGKLIDWNDHPHIVSPNETLTLNLRWVGTRTGTEIVIGNDYPNDSRFGLVIVGSIVRTTKD